MICRVDKLWHTMPDGAYAYPAYAVSDISGVVGLIKRSRHQAMGLACWIGGRVPFTRGAGEHFSHRCGERDKGSGCAPLINPRGPARKSVLRTALTSRVPDCGRLDSTYSPRSGTRPCLGSPLSAIHGVQTLSFPLRFADFSGDTTPSL